MPRIFIAFVCAFSLFATAAMAKEFSSVEEQMTSSEFKSAGLNKLSPEELAALNAWIHSNQPVAGSSVAYDRAADDRKRIGFDDSDAREDISSNIIGEFKGFGGGTILKLENGQSWQVVSGELSGIRAMTNPKVNIRPGLIGGWRLQVDGYNSVAKVKRIK
ncbi:MAG: hypothetical protein ABIP02_08015 [Arenimonas sp.]